MYVQLYNLYNYTLGQFDVYSKTLQLLYFRVSFVVFRFSTLIPSGDFAGSKRSWNNPLYLFFCFVFNRFKIASIHILVQVYIY